MITCSVPGCDNVGNTESGIARHSFPISRSLRDEWIAALKISSCQIIDNSFVCSVHFRKEDFEQTSSLSIRLKDGVVPSIFPSSNESLKMIKKEIDDEDDSVFVTVGLENENYVNKVKKEGSNVIQKKLIPTIPSATNPVIKFAEDNKFSNVIVEEPRKNEEDCFYQKEKSFICPFCQFPYKFKKTLNRHIREFHEQLKRFSCTLCDYTCSRKNHLTHHISSVHNRIKPHLCPECNYAFSEKTHLNRHILAIHQKLKPFKCSECSYAASQRGHLTKHVIRTHNKHGLFKCPHCEYCCNERSNLCRHVLSNHSISDNLIECPNCLFSCNTKQDLDQHSILFHQNNCFKNS